MSWFTLINKTLSYPCVTEWWLFSPVPIYFEDFVGKLVFQLQTEECRLWIIKDGFVDPWGSDTDYTCGHIKHIMRHGCVLTGFPPFFLNFQRTTSPVWLKICQNCGDGKATNSVVGEAINDIDILAEVIKIKWALLHVWPSLLLCMVLNPLSHFIIEVGVPIKIIALCRYVNYAGDTYTGDYLS